MTSAQNDARRTPPYELNQLQAVILAGGYGSRLQEETGTRPKPMVEIGRRPIMWHIMKIFAHYGVNRFIICLGHLGYVVVEYFANYYLHNADVTVDLGDNSIEYMQSAAEPWKVSLIRTGQDTMTGGRLKRIRHLLEKDQPFLMTYGDGLADIDLSALVDFHREHGRLATMTVVRPPGRFGSVHLDGSEITAFVEKPEGEQGYINGGFFVLDPSVLDDIEGDATVWEQEPLRRLAAEDQLMGFRHDGFWMPMDTLRERNELEAIWESGEAPWRVWA